MKSKAKNSPTTPLQLQCLKALISQLRHQKRGYILPGEIPLAKECGASRTTIRAVCQLLAENGILQRHNRRWRLSRAIRKSDYPAYQLNALSKAQIVTRHLLAEVGRGRIFPGQHFSERSLGQKLGLSASPIREALLSMAPLGLFRKQARHQWQAVMLDQKQIYELFEFRLLMETHGLKQLMRPHIFEHYKSQLLELLDKTKSLENSTQFDKSRFAKLDIMFHRLLLEAHGNKLIQERTEFIPIIVEFQLRNEHFTTERAKLGLLQHIKIMRAIMKKDAKQATKLLKQHLQSATETLLTLVGNNRRQ